MYINDNHQFSLKAILFITLIALSSCSNKSAPTPNQPTTLQLLAGSWVATDVRYHDTKSGNWVSKGTDPNWLDLIVFTNVTFKATGEVPSVSGAGFSDSGTVTANATTNATALTITLSKAGVQQFSIDALTSTTLTIGQTFSPPIGYGADPYHIVVDKSQVVYKKQ